MTAYAAVGAKFGVGIAPGATIWELSTYWWQALVFIWNELNMTEEQRKEEAGTIHIESDGT